MPMQARVFRSLKRAGLALAVSVCSVSGFADDVLLEWSQLPPLPDPIGFAGPFVGVAGDALIVAGGANFPDKLPWDGGKKIWHDSVFVLTQADGKWNKEFRLPFPNGYGVSTSWNGRMICVGGGNAESHFREVISLTWDGRRIATTKLPPLPRPCAFMSGVLHDGVLYVSGGIEAPDSSDALKSLWSLDLKRPDGNREWQVAAPIPGPGRMLAQMATVRDKVLVSGGVSLFRKNEGEIQRRYLKDAWLYDPVTNNWESAAPAPRPIVAAPNPGLRLSKSQVAFLSGDDGRFNGQNLMLKHPGFPADVFVYDAKVDRWSQTTPFPKHVPTQTGRFHNLGESPPVTTTMTLWRGRYVIASGEIRPGIRSHNVWSVRVRSVD